MSRRAVDDFRERVVKAFGPNMVHATPAAVRDFIDAIRRDQWRSSRAKQRRETGDPNPPLVFPSDMTAGSYEGVLRQFFVDSLNDADDKALIELWLFALEFAYAGIEELDADRIGKLFGDEGGAAPRT